MNAQHAIERVLQDFTKELLKVFSDAVVQAVSQVGNAGAAALPASSQSAAVSTAAKRAPRAPAAPKAPAAKAPAPRAAPKAAPKAVAPKAPRPGVVVKSTPDQVNRLSERVIEVLRKSARNLAAKEIMKAMGLRTTDEGRFQYALNKLKEDGVVQQHGERRQARYGIGTVSKPKPKRGPGRPRKVQPAEGAAAGTEGEAAEATADESLSNG